VGSYGYNITVQTLVFSTLIHIHDLYYFTDLKKRIYGQDYHLFTTVEEFIANIDNPNTVGMILDIPTSQQAIPPPFQ
jgi:hypothetical protein